MTESLQRLPHSVFANGCPWWSAGLLLLAQTFFHFEGEFMKYNIQALAL